MHVARMDIGGTLCMCHAVEPQTSCPNDQQPPNPFNTLKWGVNK